MEDSKWLVVNFTDDNTVEVIPNNWLDSGAITTRCFFPPEGTSKSLYAKLVTVRFPPIESWKPYAINILGSYDSFKIALKKAKKALSSDALLSSNSDITKNAKRKRKKNTKYEQCSSSSSREVSSTDDEQLPCPPVKNTFLKKINVQDEWTPLSCSGTSGTRCTEISKSQPNQTCIEIFNSNVPSTASTVTLFDSDLDALVGNETPKATSRATPSSTPRRTPTIEQNLFAPHSSTDSFQKQVLRHLILIRSTLDQHSENFNHLLNPERMKPADAIENVELQEIMKLLPISNRDNFDKIENFLTAAKNSEAFAHRLSRFGGDNAETMTKQLMYKILGNAVGREFSWEGAKGKSAFKNTNTAKAIISAIHLNKRTSEQGEDLVIKIIKKWLARAKEREHNASKKNLN